MRLEEIQDFQLIIQFKLHNKMAQKYLQTQPYALAGSGVSVGDTTVTLKSFTDIDGNAITMAGDFGAEAFATLEPGSRDREEQIVFTGVTNNADGTSTLTGVSNVLFAYPYTQTSGFIKSHPGGVNLVITNSSGFYDTFTNKNNSEIIVGFWTVPDPVSATGIANKEYVDNTVNGGPVSYASVIVNATAGATVASGNLVYFKSSDGRWYKTDATAASSSQGVQLGVAQGAGSAGVAITGGVLVKGIDTKNTGLVAGTTYFLSNTPGAIATSAGTFRQVVGSGDASGQFLFDPYFDLPNKTNIQNSAFTYAADAGSTDAYAITLSPVPATYATGMQFTFKANTLNTGAATLNVNGLGAKALVKNFNSPLVTGDILAGQDVSVLYDGTNFQLLSPSAGLTIPVYSNGTTTKNLADASTAQTIAHGLGVIPKRVTLDSYSIDYNPSSAGARAWSSSGVFDSSGQHSLGFVPAASGLAGTSSTAAIFVGAGGDSQTGVVSVDATNITITWTKVGTPTGTDNIVWSAQA